MPPVDQIVPLDRIALMWGQRTGGKIDEVQVDQVMKECDEDRDGFIDVLEFVRRSDICGCYMACAAMRCPNRFVRQ